jgi:membrane-associated phospholipid phosphatase
VTELLAPANLAVAQLLLVGWHGSPGPAGLGWGLLAATFCGLLPYGIVIAGVHRKRWGDRHLRARQQRPVPFLAAIASVLAGLAMLLALVFGPALILALPVVALVAWARVRLGDHTPAQTLAGAALGGLIATTVFILLR